MAAAAAAKMVAEVVAKMAAVAVKMVVEAAAAD